MFNGDGKTKVVVIRHGNTFNPGEQPRRVGARTDLDLVPSGILQAKTLGTYLKQEGLIPHAVTSAALKRTLQTAQYLLHGMKLSLPITMNPLFNEIDYGPDENQTEEKVIERVGHSALQLWDEKGIPPLGWNVQPESLVQSWKTFLNRCLHQKTGQTTFIITSNGVGRFIPQALNSSQKEIKLKTGSFSLLVHEPEGWHISRWNERPHTFTN
jgi:probable phosphoglycerate mutase